MCLTHPSPEWAERYATVSQPTAKVVAFPQESTEDVLTAILRRGARQMLATAIEAEIQVYLGARQDVVDATGRREVVRNGYLPTRTLQTPLGDVPVRQPRVRDRRPAETRETFRSAILPPYLRKTKSLEDLLPWLYLKGISTGDFSEALAALLGPEAPGVSASTITRLKTVWEQEFATWQGRSLTDHHYVYLWADGVHFNVRLEDTANTRQCILVLMGATSDGRKELIAISDGYRESEQSWRELLLDVQARGLTTAPAVATGDGAFGFCAALAKVFPSTRPQRCWVHKAANVLNKLPKSVHPKVTQAPHAIWMAETRRRSPVRRHVRGQVPRRRRVSRGGPRRAPDVLRLPGGTLAASAHRQPDRVPSPRCGYVPRRPRGAGSRVACLTMVFKLALSAQQRWRILNGAELLKDLINGETFEDGIRKHAA
jgi:putative transposase